MKRLFKALVLLLWAPVIAHAACCTIVTTGSAIDPGTVNNSTNYQTAADANAIPLGSLVVVAYANDNTNPTNLGLPTDTAGNTYARQTARYDTNQSHGTALFTSIVTNAASAGTWKLNVNKSTQASSVMVAYMVITGWNGSTVLDGAAVNAAMQGTNATVTMTTTSLPVDFLVAAFAGRDATLISINSPQSGWTAGPTASDATGITQVAMAYQITSASGTYTAGWPAITNSGNRWVLVSAMAVAGPNSATRPNLSIVRVN